MSTSSSPEVGGAAGVRLEHETRVAILGFGVEGRAVLEWLRGLGCRNITVCDKSDQLQLPGDVLGQLGDEYLADLHDFEVVFRSPGFPRDLAGIVDAEQRGTQITSASREFLVRCPCTVIGVTGSNGKSTTTELIAAMLRQSYGESLHVGGNDHEPLLDRLAAIERDHCVVLELSSFQLVDIDRSPHVSVLLNVTPNHLDVHPSFEAYLNAKSRILRFHKADDTTVLNWAFSRVRELGELSEARPLYFNKTDGERTCFLRESRLMLRWDGHEQSLLELDELPFRTSPDNIQAAVLVARLFGLGADAIRETLLGFRGRPHCLELVRVLDGVRWIDDSGSTTPDATLNAIHSFPEAGVVLIAGGYDKGLDYQALAKEAVRSQVSCVLIGAVRERLATALEQAGTQLGRPVPVSVHDTLEQAVDAARALARSGQHVVFSPGCASFDMFRNADQRGERFQELVRSLS